MLAFPSARVPLARVAHPHLNELDVRRVVAPAARARTRRTGRHRGRARVPGPDLEPLERTGHTGPLPAQGALLLQAFQTTFHGHDNLPSPTGRPAGQRLL